MGVFTDCNTCPECNKEIEDGERVVVTTVTSGNYVAIEGTVQYDNYDIESTIHHEKCYHQMGKATL